MTNTDMYWQPIIQLARAEKETCIDNENFDQATRWAEVERSIYVALEPPAAPAPRTLADMTPEERINTLMTRCDLADCTNAEHEHMIVGVRDGSAVVLTIGETWPGVMPASNVIPTEAVAP